MGIINTTLGIPYSTKIAPPKTLNPTLEQHPREAGAKDPIGKSEEGF